MAWQLEASTHYNRELEWRDALTKGEIDTLPEDCVNLGRRHGVPFHPDLPPIPYRQSSDHPEIPAICQGRWSRDVFVDQEVKDLIERFEPGAHYFHPIILHLKSGDIRQHTHFLLRAGRLIDGIIVDETQLRPKYFDGELRYYAHLTVSPVVTWRHDAVHERYL